MNLRGIYHCVMCGNGYSQVVNGQVVREWCHCTAPELHPENMLLHDEEKDDERSEQKPSDPV